MKRTIFNALFFIGTIAGLSSCDGLGGESIHDLDKPGEAKAIQKEIIEKVGDVMTYQISMSSQGELETSIDFITVTAENNATSVNEISCRIIGQAETTTEVEDNSHFVEGYIEGGSKKLSEIDFDLVQKNFEEAKTLIPAEYISHELYIYTIKFKEGKRSDVFIVNTLLKDESDHIEGGDIVTNYYEFIISMNEDGSLTVD